MTGVGRMANSETGDQCVPNSETGDQQASSLDIVVHTGQGAGPWDGDYQPTVKRE